MKNRSLHIFSSLLILLLFITGCKDNPSGNDEEEDRGEYFGVNHWIRTTMDYYYFWNEGVPEETDGDLAPETFFDFMLHEDDIFSYMTDDAETLMEELEGSEYTAGFSPAFGTFRDEPNSVFIIVEFVYPESPAKEAGLKRGDIILEINGQAMTRQNYLDLYYSSTPQTTYTLRKYDPETQSLADEETTISLTKQEMELDPVVYTDVIEKNGSTIGYMFYAQFINGKDEKFIESVDDAFSEFIAAGVNELILDLRYNPGGSISAAKSLANSIVPSSAGSNEEVFVTYEYNDELEQEIIDTEGMDSPNLVERFSQKEPNLNLDRAYFLTTSSSASASELVMIGLEPYMDVIAVGDSTFGKFYGSYVLRGKANTSSYNYAIVPVTLKYANADGFSDFREGLVPDYKVEDNLLEPKAIGDTTDPLLAKAIQHITGESEPVAKAPSRLQYQKLPDFVKLKRGNVMKRSPESLPQP